MRIIAHGLCNVKNLFSLEQIPGVGHDRMAVLPILVVLDPNRSILEEIIPEIGILQGEFYRRRPGGTTG